MDKQKGRIRDDVPLFFIDTHATKKDPVKQAILLQLQFPRASFSRMVSRMSGPVVPTLLEF
jgi:hypothetical protein